MEGNTLKIEVIAEKLGLAMEHGVPTGSVQGFPYVMNMVSIDTFVKAPMMIFTFEKGLTKEDIKAIRKVSGMTMIRVESIALKSNSLFVLVKQGLKSSEKHIQFLEKLVQVFKERGLHPLNHCPFCGKEETDSFRMIKGVPVKLHDECAKKFYLEVATQVEREERSNENMGKSLVYAVLGAIIGTIPTLITIFAFQYMIALLYALIPLASFYGYKYGNAARKSWVPAFVSIISLIIVVGMNLGLYYTIAVAESVTFSEALMVDEFKRALLSDLGTSVLFLGIGIAIAWKKMYSQTTQAIKKDYEGLNG